MKKSKSNTLYSYFPKKKKHTKNIKEKSFYKDNKFKTKKKSWFKKHRKIIIIYEPDEIKFFLKFLIAFIFSIIYFYFAKINIEKDYGLSLEQKMNDYATKKFALLQRHDCKSCGFFSFYIAHLSCIDKYINEGYIPLIDLQDFKNVYNNYTISSFNPWELFFYQPFNYTLEEVKKYAKNITYFNCPWSSFRPHEVKIYSNESSIIFWHNVLQKYMPVKKEILKEAKIIMKHLFGNSKNILGVKIRGTDYFKRPPGHSIPPKVEQVIKDVKMYDEKYKYDYIFFTTEDDNIKKKFLPEFKDKIKLLNPNDSYMINFTDKQHQYLNYVKNYFFSVIILSNCLDIISSRCAGAAGVITITKGFRNSLFYDLGVY